MRRLTGSQDVTAVAHGRRGSPSDLALGATYLLLSAGMIYLSVESSIVTPLWPMLLLTAAGVATLAVRHQFPLAAFVASLACMVASFAFGSGAEAVLVIPLLYRAGLILRPAAAWMWLAAAAVVDAIGAAVLVNRLHNGPPLLGLGLRRGAPDWATEWLNFFLLLAAAALIATLLGVNVGHRRRNIAALVDRAEQLRRERDQRASIAVAEERERIAREMHDVIAHSLSVMIALADGAEAAAERRPEESRAAIGRVAETGRRTLGEVRRLLGRVRGDDVSPGEVPQPGVAQVSGLIDEFRDAGLPVHLELSGGIPDDPALGLTIYRIVQESLTNALRHARGVREVLVRVNLGDDVEILVEDASEAAAAASDPGRGLLGIRERAALYDGEVQSGPRDGGGWRVLVRLPVRSGEK